MNFFFCVFKYLAEPLFIIITGKFKACTVSLCEKHGLSKIPDDLMESQSGKTPPCFPKEQFRVGLYSILI